MGLSEQEFRTRKIDICVPLPIVFPNESDEIQSTSSSSTTPRKSLRNSPEKNTLSSSDRSPSPHRATVPSYSEIPIPHVRDLGINNDEEDWVQPHEYIKYEEPSWVSLDYDMDSDDEKWLYKINNISNTQKSPPSTTSILKKKPNNKKRGKPKKQPIVSPTKYFPLVTPEQFERCITLFEKEKLNVTYITGYTIVTLKDTEVIKLDPGSTVEDDFDVACCICSDKGFDEDNLIVFCEGCNIPVHQVCYGIDEIPDEEWYCRVCEDRSKKGFVEPECAICGILGGAMKRGTEKNCWVHVTCAVWMPGVRFVDPELMEPIDISGVDPKRKRLKCSICKSNKGSCIQCKSRQCYASYHPYCAQQSGLHMELKDGLKSGGVFFNTYCELHGKRKGIVVPQKEEGVEQKTGGVDNTVIRAVSRLVGLSINIVEKIWNYWVQKSKDLNSRSLLAWICMVVEHKKEKGERIRHNNLEDFTSFGDFAVSGLEDLPLGFLGGLKGLDGFCNEEPEIRSGFSMELRMSSTEKLARMWRLRRGFEHVRLLLDMSKKRENWKRERLRLLLKILDCIENGRESEIDHIEAKRILESTSDNDVDLDDVFEYAPNKEESVVERKKADQPIVPSKRTASTQSSFISSTPSTPSNSPPPHNHNNNNSNKKETSPSSPSLTKKSPKIHPEKTPTKDPEKLTRHCKKSPDKKVSEKNNHNNSSLTTHKTTQTPKMPRSPRTPKTQNCKIIIIQQSVNIDDRNHNNNNGVHSDPEIERESTPKKFKSQNTYPIHLRLRSASKSGHLL